MTQTASEGDRKGAQRSHAGASRWARKDIKVGFEEGVRS